MNKAIFKYFASVLILTLLFSTTVSMVILSDQMLSNTKKDMFYALRLAENQIDYQQPLNQQINKLNDLAYTNQTRLTIIDEKGKVLADTDKTAIKENHSDREEFKEAMLHKYGYATRYSSTLRKNMVYVAYFHRQHIVRIAIPYNGVFDNAAPLVEPLTISALLSLCIALAMAYRFSQTLTQPLREISEEVSKIKDNRYLSFNYYSYDEFNIIATKLKEQAETIQNTMESLKNERIKINSILDQMNEGFILLDENQSVLMCNIKAKQLFDSQMELNHSVEDYIFDYKIIDQLDTLGAEPKIVTIKKDEETYHCYIAKVDYGVTLLFVNVTDSVNAMKVRQEFFSNVSHELKTPMTSIRGYSELLQTGMIDNPEVKKQALDKIQKEVDHMSSLISDILMISRLENKDVEVVLHPVHLKPIVDDILESLQVEIDKKGLTVNTDLTEVTYLANHQHMQQLMNNLINNAVKYNQDQGSIKIDSYVSEHDYVIEVSDTGRGISLIDQGRVFERFFRCDPGRDKETGGTGLGLAIVKHIVQYYQGTIQLQSKLGEGTTFKIILPIKE
ncbi:sensor histidine kinase [Erysipelatoclostridium sp. AM42-17]|uniref:sensor histidine kinase n=1 Tax=Erysipelatoclostridium sp. AM42-17 TaxID=2293102 RepID=UPI000E55803B|nr:ATP-binding protein [Erysipelatoclostridium sp. AM42-17]RHS92173.1 GHKL domain-containing protein [Erysipelatoclostridium sp. AM42-17]